jgi:hypothetical protein
MAKEYENHHTFLYKRCKAYIIYENLKLKGAPDEDFGQ